MGTSTPMVHVYSPLPINDYRLIGLEVDETLVIQKSQAPLPLWNLFWLSNPTLDIVPNLKEKWWKAYKPNTHLLSGLIRDVYTNPTLCSKLIGHPVVFSTWFEYTPHRGYHAYDVAGGQRWVDQVLIRADVAARRINSYAPLMKFSEGKLKLM